MEIFLPARMTEENLFDFLSCVIEQGNPKYTEVNFDFSSLEFIDPVGQIILSNTVQWLQKKGVPGKFIHVGINNPAIKYLDDARFFQLHLQSHTPLSPKAQLRNTTLPISRLNHDQADNWLRGKFISWMSERTRIPEKALTSIKSSLMEIFNNIKDHSQEGIGCCVAQHFPKNQNILLAISDFGVGIPTQMATRYPGSDCALILKACEEGVSTKSIPQNRGAGLHLLVKNVVELNSGEITVYSNSGHVTFFKNGNKVWNKHDDSPSNYYPGTLFVVKFPTNTIIPDEEEEFTWS